MITPSPVDFYGVGIQSDGNLVVAGDFSGSLELGGQSVQSQNEGTRDVFAAGLDADGGGRWLYTAGGDNSTRGFSLAIGPSDEIVLAGSFIGSSTFGDTAQTSAGEDDMHLTGLTPDGRYLWDVTFGGDAIDELAGVATNSAGTIVACGETRGDLDLGPAGSHTAAKLHGGRAVLRRTRATPRCRRSAMAPTMPSAMSLSGWFMWPSTIAPSEACPTACRTASAEAWPPTSAATL